MSGQQHTEYSVWIEVEQVLVFDGIEKDYFEATDGLDFAHTARFGTREEADQFAKALHAIGQNITLDK